MGLKRWDVQWDQFSRRSPKVWGMNNGSKLGSKVVGFFDIFRQGEAWLSPLRTVTCSLRVAMMRSWSFGMWRLWAKNMGQTVDDFSVYFCLRENAQSHAKIIQRLHLYTLVWWFLFFWFDLCKMTLIGWSLCGTSSEGTFLWLVGSFQECQADPTGHGSWFSCWNCVDGLQILDFSKKTPLRCDLLGGIPDSIWYPPRQVSVESGISSLSYHSGELNSESWDCCCCFRIFQIL